MNICFPYNLKRNIGATAIKLDSGDEIVSIIFTNDDKIGITSQNGNFIMITTSDIRSIGRVSRGVCGMKLNEGDCVVSARAIPQTTTELISVSAEGYIKRTSINEFKITGRATKGVKIQNATSISDFLPIEDQSDIIVTSSNSQICIPLSDIPLLTRGTQGVKAIKLADNSKILKLQRL